MRAIPVSVWKEAKTCLKCIHGNFLYFTLQAGLIAAKIFDLCTFPEVIDLLWQIFKLNTRSLTTTEEKEARKVFGESINYSKIRIDEFSFIAWIGAIMNRCLKMGVTTFHTINFNRKIQTEAGNADMKWLIHELTHIAQMEHCGSKYLVEAIYAQVMEGYAYKLGSKPHLRDYNREQQASIIADYYAICSIGGSTETYNPYIAELRAGEL